ncbi:MAG: hypothetical protein AABX90_00185 [Nanoarchaeota archaeon]
MTEVSIEVAVPCEEGSRKESQKAKKKPEYMVFGTTDEDMILREFEHYAEEARTQKQLTQGQNPKEVEELSKLNDSNEQTHTYFSGVVNWSKTSADYLPHKLIAAATFWTDQCLQLNHDINREPDRLQVGKLRRLSDDSYIIQAVDSKSGEEYRVNVPSQVIQAPWAAELVREADEEYKRNIEKSRPRVVHVALPEQYCNKLTKNAFFNAPISLEEFLIKDYSNNLRQKRFFSNSETII